MAFPHKQAFSYPIFLSYILILFFLTINYRVFQTNGCKSPGVWFSNHAFFYAQLFWAAQTPRAVLVLFSVNITMYNLELTIPNARLDDCRRFLIQNYCSEGIEYTEFIKHDYTVFKFYLRSNYSMCKFAWMKFTIEASS